MSARISRECSYHARSCHQSDHVIANLLSRRTSEQTITWPRFLTTVIGVARGCSGCKCTPKRIFFWGGWWRWIYGGKLLVHPRGRECTPWEGRSHIFTGRRRVRRVIYGGFHGVRRMETKKVVSISGNSREHPQQESWLRVWRQFIHIITLHVFRLQSVLTTQLQDDTTRYAGIFISTWQIASLIYHSTCIH